MTYYLHRISHCWPLSKRMFDDGYLTIGWSAISREDLVNLSVENNLEEFKNFYLSKYPKSNPNRLIRFLKFRGGDTVVVPLPNKEFAIVEISENEKIHAIDELDQELKQKFGYKPEDDIGFYVKFKLIIITQRCLASKNLQLRMKVRQVNVEIEDLKADVNKAKFQKLPFNLHQEIRNITNSNILKCIRELSDSDLENLVAWYMKNIGATNAKVLPKDSSEKQEFEDADVLAEFESLGVVFLVQVKAHEGITDDWAVQQIDKFMELRINNSRDFDGLTYIPWVISTCDKFSEMAEKKALDANIRLVNGTLFVQMLLDAGIENINSDIEYGKRLANS